MDPNDPSYAQQRPQGTYAEDPNAAGDPQQQQMPPQQGGDQGGMDVSFDAQGGDPNQGQMDPQDSQGVQDPAQATGDVDDQQIDQTLDSQGQWSDVDGYGRVWRPDATVVGADFTPYESDGSWVDTDAGWAFDSGYSWGWLPFHYGRWGWFGNYWGWQPGYRYGASWCDWRSGGGVVGWRPSAPIGRGPNARPLALHDSHWKFAAEGQLGGHNIRSHEYGNAAEALRQTHPVSGGLAYHSGVSRVPAASLMHGRTAVATSSFNTRGTNGFGRGTQMNQSPRGMGGSQPVLRNGNAGNSIQQRGDTRGAPTWQRQAPQGYRQPSYRPSPQQSYRAPAYRQSAPSRQAPSYRMPSNSYRSSGGSSYHSSGGSSYHSSGGSSHSSGGGGHSGGGGGHRR